MNRSWQVLIALLFTSPLVAASETKANSKAELEDAAEKLPFLLPGDFSTNAHWLRWMPEVMADAYRKNIVRIVEQPYDVKDLLELLKSDKPRIRTAAALALYAQFDPKLLPHLVPLANDTTETFANPGASTRSAAPFGFKPEPPKLEKQTVGQVVAPLLREYLGAAGYHGVEAKDGKPG